MRLKHFAALILAALGATAASAAYLDTVRGTPNVNESFLKMNGSPIHRFTMTPDSTTPESNLTAAGGVAQTYTLFGGERLCFQSAEAAYIEVIASGSMTAAGAKAFRIDANESIGTSCITTRPGQLSVSSLCVSGACTAVKAFEVF